MINIDCRVKQPDKNSGPIFSVEVFTCQDESMSIIAEAASMTGVVSELLKHLPGGDKEVYSLRHFGLDTQRVTQRLGGAG